MQINNPCISNALFTKTQQRVLGLLFGAPGKTFYTNEIVRIAAVGRGTVTRELVKLAEAGVLTVSAEKNQKHYQANPNCLVYAELVKIARKLFEVEIPKREAKPKLKVKPVVKAKPQPKQKPQPIQKSELVQAKPKATSKLVEKAAEKPAEVVEEKPQESKLVVEKDAPKPVIKRDITITVDEEGQMGFF